MPEPLRACDSCGQRQAAYHISIRFEIVGARASKTKRIQLHLCPRCELSLAQVLAADDETQRERLAARLTHNSAFMSRTREWQALRSP